MFTIAICDDDKLVSKKIEQIIMERKLYKENVYIESFLSGKELLETLKRGEQFDLIFLDIQMQEVDGVVLGKKIREELKNDITQIAYISIREDYAMQLFENRPIDFLIKPVSEDKVCKIVDKAMELSNKGTFYFVWESRKMKYQVSYNKIIYFSSKARIVNIYMADDIGECYEKLDDIEGRIVSDDFVRIHKSFLVNRHFVSEWRYDVVKLTNGMVLSISKQYRKSVREQLLKLGGAK